MSITLIQIQRWTKMFMGKSIEHVNQGVGKVYSRDMVKGFYNDLTEKVLFDTKLLYNDNLPLIKQLDGQSVLFPVAVFQYALGCYDLWISRHDQVYKNKFLKCAEWTIINQDDKGRWDNFSFVYADAPYGAMAQGEGTSVLLRAYNITEDNKYLLAAKKAIDFMILDIKDGGTTNYDNNQVVFCEFTNLPIVLNGWIFSWWGIYDYVKTTHDCGKYKDIMKESLNSLMTMLPLFSNHYWSIYDLDRKVSSPFYHKLHIAQMKVMYDLTGYKIFNEYATVWEKRERNPICKSIAFIVKAVQKIKE